METEGILTEKFLYLISRYRFVDVAPTVQLSILHPGHRDKWQKAEANMNSVETKTLTSTLNDKEFEFSS